MRKLVFGKEQVDKDNFDILYGGMCISPYGASRAELGIFNRLIEKMESVTKPIEKPDPRSIVLLELSDAGGEVRLEEPEFALLNRLHQDVTWRKVAAAKAEAAYKWLESIPEESI